MFVRWKKRKLATKSYWRKGGYSTTRDRVLLVAVLVESKRVDGKPRQKFIASLASIELCEGDGADHPETHADTCTTRHIMGKNRFWHFATKSLDRLGDRLSPDERQRIESALAERVPKRSEAEDARIAEQISKLNAGLGRAVL